MLFQYLKLREENSFFAAASIAVFVIFIYIENTRKMQVNPTVETQDAYPHCANYSIVPVTTEYANGDVTETVDLYFLKLPLNVEDKDSNIIYGSVYFKLYKESDIKAYFTEYASLCASDDVAASLNVSSLLNGNDMFVSYNIYEVISGVNESGRTYDVVYIKDEDVITEIPSLTYDELYNKDIRHWTAANSAKTAAVRGQGVYANEELDDFASTFFNIIKQYSGGKDTGLDTVTGKIYSSAISYYINGKSDEAVSLLDLILSSSFSYTPQSTVSSSCSCSSAAAAESIDGSCAAKYQDAMDTWLTQMMQDIAYFYNKYFYVEYTDEETGGTCYKPDTDLVDALVTLIDEFEAALYDLSFTADKAKFNVCNCGKNTDTFASECNYAVLDNFKTLLSYIKENEVEGNENKIRLYGKAMATLLPKMYF